MQRRHVAKIREMPGANGAPAVPPSTALGWAHQSRKHGMQWPPIPDHSVPWIVTSSVLWVPQLVGMFSLGICCCPCPSTRTQILQLHIPAHRWMTTVALWVTGMHARAEQLLVSLR